MKRIVVIIATVAALALPAGAYAIGRASADGGNKKTADATAEHGTAGHDMADMPSTTVAGHDMADMASVDDRGFSKLANGEEHAPTFTQGMSKADRIELGRQLVLAREVALQYPTVKDAEAGGLRRAGPFSPGLGAHYVSYANAVSNPDGVMSDDDIRKPLAWIYEGTHQDSRVLGLFYMTGKKNPEGFAGPNDTWHVHTNICIKNNAKGEVDAPLGADRGATKAQCDAVGGDLLEQTQYLTHVWVVPGFESPEGVFSHLTSAVTCDDGTYETIADVTKTGTATTICKDGSE